MIANLIVCTTSSDPISRIGCTPEQAFVLDCARRAFGRVDELAGKPLAPGQLDWSAAVKLAHRGGLTPLVYSGLPTDDETVPVQVQAVLRLGYLGAQLRNDAYVSQTLRQVLTALRDRDLEPIVLKGAALAYLAYPKPTHRTFSDIDLLLPPNDLTRASDVLHELGFWTRVGDIQPKHHLQMRYSPDGQIGIELHHQVVESADSFSIAEPEFWLRSR